MTTPELAGRIAIVTGGGAGIGRGVSKVLAAQGADVAIVDIDGPRANEAAEAVRSLGRRATTIVADVMDTAQLGDAVLQAAEVLGHPDILVNNAGGVARRRFLDQSERSWRRHIDINLLSVLAATSAAARLMVRGGRGGAIVNVASIEATRAAPMYAVYGACKAAMVSFTKSMALELAEHGIRVNAIAPDMTATPGNHGLLRGPVPDPLPSRSPTRQGDLASYIPLGREGLADECGEAVAFLCSDRASYVTGTVLPVDGGTWASSGWSRSRDGAWSLFGADRPMTDPDVPAG